MEKAAPPAGTALSSFESVRKWFLSKVSNMKAMPNDDLVLPGQAALH